MPPSKPILGGLADDFTGAVEFAAMLRAGHPLDSAREMVNAPSIAAAEDWAAQASEDEACD